MKTSMGAPTLHYVVAIVFMLNCLRCNYCIESFPAVNNPLWLRWLREQRNNNPSSNLAPVSLLDLQDQGKEAKQERGERTINPRRFAGFAFFNEFGVPSTTSTTAKPELTTLNYPSQQPQLSNGVTFANLLERARLRTTEETTLTTPISFFENEETTTPVFSSTTTTRRPTTTTSTTTLRPLTTLNELLSSRATSRYKPRAVTSLNPHVSQRLIKNFRVPESRLRISKRRQTVRARSKAKLTTVATTTTTSTTTTTATTTTSSIFTSMQTASAMLVTRTVTSTEESVPVTTTSTTTTSTTSTTTTTTTTTTEEPTTTTYLLDDTTTVLPLAQLIYSGQYHEVNPGQYHEVNPGQYHEVNPGQYHEVNPGQYYEDSPGQYYGDSLGQYQEPETPKSSQEGRSLNDVQVEVKQTENTKIYNVQSKVDKFIIGEYGTISKESGQTLQGVRYTAVADVSVDPNLIYETLIKYFPMNHHGEDQQGAEPSK